MSERRYTDEEIGAIFERAAEQQELQATVPPAREGGEATSTALTSGAGMTLRELQDIGREAGIAPELVARAASALDRAGMPSVRRFLGLPIGVGRTVMLDRRLSEAEWEHLVVQLRQVFDARGRVRDDGAFKQWTNGNLQALLEPTPAGQQVRLKTLNGAAFTWMNTGLATIGFAALFTLAKLVTGGFGGGAPAGLLITGMGLAMFALGALRLPGWARLRSRQMQSIAEGLADSTSADATPGRVRGEPT